MLRFTLFGFPVTVHWMFWVMTAVLGGALDAKSPQEWQNLLLWVVAAFLSILIHEFGHTFTQRRFGARAQILLYAFGGLAIPDRGFTRAQHIIVSLAGPVVQIMLGFVAWEALNAWNGSSLRWGDLGILSHFGVVIRPGDLLEASVHSAPFLAIFGASMAVVSVFWGLFNLVPIMPLDGGHVLLRLLGPQKEKTVWLVGLVCAAGLTLYMLAQGNIWNTVLFGMLAWENLQRMQGRTPPPFMRP